MQHNTDNQTAGEARQPVESTQIETLTWEAWQEPKPRNYDDAMVEDLAKTHAQTLVKLDKAKAQADKLAEACKQALGLYSALLLSEPVKATVDGQQYVLNQMRDALAEYESEVQS